MIFRFVVLPLRMHSLLFGLHIYVLYLKLPQGLYYMSANSKGSGETTLKHSWSPKVPFSYVLAKSTFETFKKSKRKVEGVPQSQTAESQSPLRFR